MYTPEQLASSLADVRDAAEAVGRDPAQVRGAVFCWGTVDADADVARREVIEDVSAVYQQDFSRLADRYLLHGDPDRVVGRAREYADAGAETLIFSPRRRRPAARDRGPVHLGRAAARPTRSGRRRMNPPNVVVIGGGQMGAGIVQSFLTAGSPSPWWRLPTRTAPAIGSRRDSRARRRAGS